MFMKQTDSQVPEFFVDIDVVMFPDEPLSVCADSEKL